MRVITGSLKVTPLPWLPVLANIPPKVKRKEALENIVRKHEDTNNLMLSLVMKTIPRARLKSRKTSWVTRKALLNSDFKGTTDWCSEWKNV